AGWGASGIPGARRPQGYDTAEIIGRHFSRFFTPEDQTAGVPARVLRQAKDAGRCESEGWRLRKDGSRFWASSLVQPLYDPAGAVLGFAEITRDITERMAAQQALVGSERRFRLLGDAVGDYAVCMLHP